ncbi:MAG TPA: hypothetical protein V6D17_24890 [Candidatus Obscuribacterales bacterium]
MPPLGKIWRFFAFSASILSSSVIYRATADTIRYMSDNPSGEIEPTAQLQSSKGEAGAGDERTSGSSSESPEPGRDGASPVSEGARQSFPGSAGSRFALDWPLVRKIESLVFASMIVAIPFFAFRVIDVTSTQRAVKETALLLVQDLVRAKNISKEYGLAMTVSGRPGTKNEPSGYVIQNGERVIEQVVLPKGVTVLGSVTFNEQGVPNARGTFTVSKGWKVQSVSVNSEGIAAVE